ncbi:flotillin-like protein 4 [Camellia sinensis]|uniref:flotillin-like protein 4 n=1 Tax=Camellia sinensis TaxID=4442 RepID=UPI0010368AAA|nr:flotillin-like protein 4 [Camellia sinensis]
MYKVASASEYLVITGVGIPDIKIAKKAWVLPGQCCAIFDVSPVNYTFNVQAMSAEKLAFVLPAVFTVGPRIADNDPNSLKYAKLVSPHDKLSSLVKDLVQGIIEGETRVLAASMTMEEIFRGTKEFKQEVFEKVQLELNQFGLLIYNANVKQLVDVPGHEYFSYLGQKTQMEAANQEKIDVAEAKMKGDIGAKLREGQTLQNVAKIDLDTKIISTQRQGKGKKQEIRVKTEVKVFENLREAEVAEANAELAKRKAGWAREAQVAEVEAMKAVALWDAELQWEVEIMNGLTRTEKIKAEFLSKATVEHEIKIYQISALRFRILQMDRDYSSWIVKYRGANEKDFTPVLVVPGKVISYDLNSKTLKELRDCSPKDLENWEIYQISALRFRILQMDRDYSSWIVKYRGANEKDFTLVLVVPGKVISYDLNSKTLKELRDCLPEDLENWEASWYKPYAPLKVSLVSASNGSLFSDSDHLAFFNDKLFVLLRQIISSIVFGIH